MREANGFNQGRQASQVFLVEEHIEMKTLTGVNEIRFENVCGIVMMLNMSVYKVDIREYTLVLIGGICPDEALKF